MEKILNLLPLTKTEQLEFLAAAPGCEQVFHPTDNMSVLFPPSPADWFVGKTIILGNPSPADLTHATDLKWLQTWSAGTDAYNRPGILPPNALLTSATGAYGQSVSEHMLAMLLSLMKKLPLYRDGQFSGSWQDLGAVKTLVGAKVLLLGTGDLGSSFALLCKALGAYTIGLRRYSSKPAPGVDEMHALSEVDSFLPQADVVAMTLPGTQDNRHFMDERRLSLMKKDAILINAGRGRCVDTDALTSALQNGNLWGAGLDVTQPEPLPQDHPLWQCPNVFITPHIAGGEHLSITRDRIVSIALENLRNYLAGQPLRNRVN